MANISNLQPFIYALLKRENIITKNHLERLFAYLNHKLMIALMNINILLNF